MLSVLFLLGAVPTSAVLALNTPLGQVADEPAHVLRAMSIVHGQWIGRRGPATGSDGRARIDAGLDVDQALLGVQGGPPAPKLTLEALQNARSQGWAGFRYFYSVPNVAIYTPTFYLPAAAAMAATRRSGGGPHAATVNARLVNVAGFALLGLAALLLASRGHALLFCTLALPMTLSLAGSVNPDGLMIAATALAAALLTRSPPWVAGAPAWPSTAAFWLAAILLAAIAAAKPPYAPLLLALLWPLPAWRDYRALWRPLATRIALIALLLLPGIAWGWFALTNVATGFDRPPYEAGPIWPGPRPAVFDETNAAAQLQVLLATPIRLLTLPWHTLRQDAGLLRSAVGVLGWLHILLPTALYVLWYWAIPASVLGDALARRSDDPRGRLADLGCGLIAILGSLILVYLTQYLSWTRVGAATVDGVQGRYLLPLLPFVALFAPAFSPRWGPAVRAALVILPAVAVLAGLVILPGIVVDALILR